MKRSSNIEPLKIRVYQHSEIADNVGKKGQHVLPSIIPKGFLRKDFKLSYNDYSPLEAPFVVDIIKDVVNAIEKNRYLTSKWECNVFPRGVINNTFNHSIYTIFTRRDLLLEYRAKIVILTYDECIHFCREILQNFFPRLIHFLNEDFSSVLSRSLYDGTMRPNPKFNDIVRHVMLRSSRTIIDTAAFMMIHLFHTWENASNMIETKKHIVKVYGRLMISFECKPIFIDQTDLTPESCILRIILETTDVGFWNDLSSKKVFEAFTLRTHTENKMIRHVRKYDMFPNLRDILKYDLPYNKLPLSTLFPMKEESAKETVFFQENKESFEDTDRSTAKDSVSYKL